MAKSDKPKTNIEGMEVIPVVKDMKEKHVRPPTIFNKGLAIGLLVGAAAGFWATFPVSLAIIAAAGIIGGMIRKRNMVTEYSEALDFRDNHKKKQGQKIEKKGRSAEIMNAIEKGEIEADKLYPGQELSDKSHVEAHNVRQAQAAERHL